MVRFKKLGTFYRQCMHQRLVSAKLGFWKTSRFSLKIKSEEALALWSLFLIF